MSNSFHVMREIQNVFPRFSDEIDFFFAFGTLLGIIRDEKLLSRDMDLDMVVFLKSDKEIEKFRRYLQNNGFERLHSYRVSGVGINQDTFIYDDVMVDINYAKKSDKKYYNYLFYDIPEGKNKILIFPFTYLGSKTFEFENTILNIPNNPELYLEEIYGSDWHIPNPKYIYWENPQAIKIDLSGEVEIINKFKDC